MNDADTHVGESTAAMSQKDGAKAEEEAVPWETKKVYTGEKIALDFYDTDIKNVLRILMEMSDKNFAIDKGVTGKVTLTLEKPIPWDQVLDLVLRMNNLDMVEEGDVIRIAPLSVFAAEENARRARMEASKQSQVKKEELLPLYTKYFRISYADASSDIMPQLKAVKTKRGIINVDKRSNQIIMTDTREALDNAKKIVRNLDRVTPQVSIEARIVEASTNFSRELGVEWGAGVGVQMSNQLDSGLSSALSSGITTLLDNQVGLEGSGNASAVPAAYTNGGTVGTNLAMNYPSSTSNGIGFNFIKLGGTPFLLNAKLTAMETSGEGKVISTPKVITLDNKKATITQGVSYPYYQLDSSGNSTTEFKDIALTLEVEPHVTPDNRISMKIKIDKNDLGSVINGQQAFTTKSAETELLTNDGDTVVIGGVMKENTTKGESGFPVLKEIPVIGWLFKSKTGTVVKEELLIFITPRVIQFEQVNP